MILEYVERIANTRFDHFIHGFRLAFLDDEFNFNTFKEQNNFYEPDHIWPVWHPVRVWEVATVLTRALLLGEGDIDEEFLHSVNNHFHRGLIIRTCYVSNNWVVEIPYTESNAWDLRRAWRTPVAVYYVNRTDGTVTIYSTWSDSGRIYRIKW
jgi:hypothetical protein